MNYLRLCLCLVTLGALGTPAPAATPTEELLRSAAQAFRKGDPNEALRLATQAADADPRNADCYLTLAALRDARREFDQAVACYTRAIELTPNSTLAWERRGEDCFRLGRFKDSVADFDKVVALEPAREPHHWQRGISLFYAGEFERGARQFELHQTVNPQDVENAVWHYLCVAKTAGVEQARKNLIDIRRDARVPLMQIYALFQGQATPEDVLKAARAGEPGAEALKERLFYAHLYIGLYQEANGQTDAAREQILLADQYAGDGYMGDVARVHRALVAKAGA
jgi:lipoprotein NlpI